MKRLLFGVRTGKYAGIGTFMFGVLASGCITREVKEQEPTTSNVFVEQVREGSISEIDLLFVIDNSASMGDKQEILRRAVPQMVSRLVNPLCKNEEGEAVANPGQCPEGFQQEFRPVNDIHIGVISSSLGGHGSSQCKRSDSTKNYDDQAHLIPTKRPGTSDPTGLGFLAWTGGDEAKRTALETDFEAQVIAVGENGCGFEAPLEAFYRFLVDPEPPAEIVVENNRAVMATNADGNRMVDGTVLAQREAFLRPEGLVAIVVLTDENDCSAMDGGSYYNNAGFGYLMVDRPSFEQNGRKFPAMPVAAPVCETNPNDKCCFSCLQKVPDGCDASFCDVREPVAVEDDRINARCFDNKRRFGVDLLYPTSRYVEALTKSTIVNARTGESTANPLFHGTGANRGKQRMLDRVFFAGIVGVPWQDIATDESLTDPDVMQYRTSAELLQDDVELSDGTTANRWEVILGDPGLPVSSPDCRTGTDPKCGAVPTPPLDPFMIESIEPRMAGLTNPITGDVIVESSSTNPLANGINGHEVNHLILNPNDSLPMRDDLQYACIFPLEEAKVGCPDENTTCDCETEPDKNSPLCQPEFGGPAGTTQYFGKAYPGTRILQVLRDVGTNSIVGSICPKVAIGTDIKDPSYGYNPAVQAIVDRLAVHLSGKCLPRELTLNSDGTVPCAVVETRPASEGALDCNQPGRSDVSPLMEDAIIAQLEESDLCAGNSGIPCNTYSMCAIDELKNDAREQCLFDESDPANFDLPGFCYIDPAKKDDEGNYIAGGDEDGNNPIVAECSPTQRRLLRFVGSETPAKKTTTFVACTADAASARDEIPAVPTAEAGEAAQ